MKVLLTGSSGFIGRNLANRLQSATHSIVPYDKTQGDDVRDLRRLRAASEDCHAIVHCAGWVGTHHSFECIGDVVATNITGTLNVLEVATALDLPVVVVSLKNDWLNPYMITKQASAKFVQMYHAYRGTKTVLLRAMNVFGPHQGIDKQKIVPDFIVNALQDTPLTIFGNGEQIIDMTYVDDLAEVVVRSLDREVWGADMEVGTGVPATVIEVARAVEEILQKKLELRRVPMRIGEPDCSISLANCAAVKRLLDYCPSTPWRVGLRRTVEWYRANMRIDRPAMASATSRR